MVSYKKTMIMIFAVSFLNGVYASSAPGFVTPERPTRSSAEGSGGSPVGAGLLSGMSPERRKAFQAWLGSNSLFSHLFDSSSASVSSLEKLYSGIKAAGRATGTTPPQAHGATATADASAREQASGALLPAAPDAHAEGAPVVSTESLPEGSPESAFEVGSAASQAASGDAAQAAHPESPATTSPAKQAALTPLPAGDDAEDGDEGVLDSDSDSDSSCAREVPPCPPLTQDAKPTVETNASRAGSAEGSSEEDPLKPAGTTATPGEQPAAGADKHVHGEGCEHDHDDSGATNPTVDSPTVKGYLASLNESPRAIAGTGFGLGALVAVGFVVDAWVAHKNLPVQKDGTKKSFPRYLKEQLAQPMDWSKEATWFKAGFGIAVGGGCVLALARYVNPVNA